MDYINPYLINKSSYLKDKKRLCMSLVQSLFLIFHLCIDNLKKTYLKVVVKVGKDLLYEII